jgi:uncharacterized repeat protein (TIGR03803 family)
VRDTVGNLYGVTSASIGYFNNGYGTVFRISPSGQVVPLHTFSGQADGAQPQTLIFGSDGNFYGTTANGGPNGAGTIFQLTPSGTLTTLHAFAFPDYSDFAGGVPAGLTQGSDGNLYGTTMLGGVNGGGTIFKLTGDGTLTTLYSFSGSPNGCMPNFLIQGKDGDFYGTTLDCGLSFAGTFFKITPSGQETALYSFEGVPFRPSVQFGILQPPASLLETTEGHFLVTTPGGGDANLGAVLELDVSSAPPAPELRMTAVPTTIYLGDSSELYWSSIGTNSCAAHGAWRGTKSTTDSQSVKPAAVGSYSYYLTCKTAGRLLHASTTVTVNAPPPPAIIFGANGTYPLTVTQGTQVTLGWSTDYARRCEASGAWSGSQPIAGSFAVDTATPGTNTYTLTCRGAGGESSASVTVTVTVPSS